MKNKHLSKRWKKLSNQRWLFLLCFILGFLSWQAIRRNISHEMTISDIQIEINIPKNWAVWEKSIQTVNVEFRGSWEDLRYLNKEQLRMVIPVKELTANNQIKIKLSDAYLKNPTRAKAISFSPAEMIIKLDQKHERFLPVKVAVKGAPPSGIELDKIICSPATVKVIGARHILAGMENIYTEPIPLKGRQRSFKTSVPIALPEATRIAASPDWVSVDFFFVQRNATKQFKNIPVKILYSSAPPKPFLIHPKTISVTLKGEQQRIEKILPENLFAYIDCSDLSENSEYDLSVNINLPPGVVLVKTTPNVIHVTNKK